MLRTIIAIGALLLLLVLVPAALASPASAERRAPSPAVVAGPLQVPQAGLVESGAVPTAGVVVGTMMIVGGLWTPRRHRR